MELILLPSINAAIDLFQGVRWTWQQDSAPPHRAIRCQEYLQSHVPDYIVSGDWLPKSPDVAVLDYGVFPFLKQLVYRERFSTLPEMKAVITRAWDRFPQISIKHAIDAWKRRMMLVVREHGSHIQQFLDYE